MNDDHYVLSLLLTPGTVIRRPVQIPGMSYEFYDTLEILDSYGVGCWLALARVDRQNHVYRLRHDVAQGLRAERIEVRA